MRIILRPVIYGIVCLFALTACGIDSDDENKTDADCVIGFSFIGECQI